jgi:hypothetical protein
MSREGHEVGEGIPISFFPSHPSQPSRDTTARRVRRDAAAAGVVFS